MKKAKNWLKVKTGRFFSFLEEPSWHWCMWILKFLEELLQIPTSIFVGWGYCHFALPSTPESSSIHLSLVYGTIIFLFPSHLSNLYLMFCLIPDCLHKVLFHHPTAHGCFVYIKFKWFLAKKINVSTKIFEETEVYLTVYCLCLTDLYITNSRMFQSLLSSQDHI